MSASTDERTLEAYEKARSLEQAVSAYGAKLDQDEILERAIEIRQLLEFVDGEEVV